MSNDYEFLWKLFENTNRWVIQADTKAAGLLATNGIIVGMIFTHLSDIVPVVKLSAVIAALSLVGLVLLLASAFCAIQVIKPRLTVGESSSVIFFQHVAKLTAVDYGKKLKAISDAERVDQIIDQIWANAKVAVKKHRFVLYSIRCLVTAIAIFLLPLFNYAGMQH